MVKKNFVKKRKNGLDGLKRVAELIISDLKNKYEKIVQRKILISIKDLSKMHLSNI